MLDELFSLDNRRLLEILDKYSNDEKKELLSNAKIKAKFMMSDDDYPFIWLIQSLTKEHLEIFLDNTGINILLASHNLEHKLNALMTLDDTVNYDVLSNNKIMQSIYDNYQFLYSYLSSMNEVFVDRFFHYLIDNNLDFYKIRCCSRNLSKIFAKNIDVIIEKKLIDSHNLTDFDNVSIEVLLENKYFQDMILSDDKVLYNIILRGTKIPEQLLAKQLFIDKLVNCEDIDKYRFLINNLSLSSNLAYLDNIDEKRNKYYDNLIDSYNSDKKMFKKYENIFNSLFQNGKLISADLFFDSLMELPEMIKYDINCIFYKNGLSDNLKIEELKRLFVKITNIEFNKALIDCYYQDISYNFLLNLDNMVKFNLKKQAISNDNLVIYKKILELNKNEACDIAFYKSFKKDKNYVEEFYNDFRASKDVSYQTLNESLLDVSHLQETEKVHLSKIDNVDIYEMDGENFYLLIHNTTISKDESFYNADKILKPKQKSILSLSLISDKRLDYFNDYDSHIVLGFRDISIDNIIHMYNSDSFSSDIKEKQGRNVSNKVTKLYTPLDLMKETKGYNEIVYQVKTDDNALLNIPTLKPSYVITFDEITKFDIKTAQKFGIPIIKINKEKYLKNAYKKTSVFDEYDIVPADSYVNSYFDVSCKSR